MTAPFARRLLAEFTGTALLVAIVVGAGVAAQRLSPTDAGLQLLETSTAVGLGLTVLILMFAPVSGGHFNPVLSIANWYFGRHDRSGLRLGELPGYLSAQLLGGVVGAALANVMFDLPALQIATEHHISSGRVIGEVVATAGLIAAIFAVAQTGRAARSAAVVGGYVGSVCWWSSSSFVNPAVSVARMFSDTPSGIAPSSVPGYVVAQVIGGVLGLGLVAVLYPRDRRLTRIDIPDSLSELQDA